MKHLQSRHWTLVALFLTALAAQLMGIAHWREAITPMFCGGVLAQTAVFIRALHTEPPRRRRDRESFVDKVARYHR